MTSGMVSIKQIDSHLSRRAKLQRGFLPGLLGSHLHRAEQTLFRRMQRILSSHGLTPSEFGILLLIHDNPGLSQSDLGRAIRADRSTVVALIDRFENRKLVERQPSPFDRRSHALRLTEPGQKAMTDLVPQVQGHEQEILSRLSVDEQSQLIDLLNKISSE